MGFTAAVIPNGTKDPTLCLGLAAGAQFPAKGRAAAGGPLPMGNLSNSKAILDGGSFFFGVQATPTIGVQATANSSGYLWGPTGGSKGLTAGVSASGCSDKLFGKIAATSNSIWDNRGAAF